MSVATETAMIAGAEVLVAGQPLAPELQRGLIEVRVEDNLMLPDAFLIRIADPGLALVDSNPLEVGAEVEIRLAGSEARALSTVLRGQIATLEPDFSAVEAILAARGYDHSHALHRTPRTETYQNMTTADIVRKVAQHGHVELGTVQDAGPVYDFVQQTQETDWTFLWRLAAAIDFEVMVIDRKLNFRRAGGDASRTTKLAWGENLVAFRPRITGIQQVDRVVVRGWDPAQNRAIEASSRGPAPDSRAGIDRDQVKSALGGGEVSVADRPVASQDEAESLASSLASRLANAAVEAEGTCRGDATLHAGSRVEITGVGRRFSGTYTLTATTHLYRGAQGYRTHFTISGRTSRSLLDLMTPAQPRPWGSSLVVAVVTQNQDPEQLGRIRVKYPALGQQTEGWWARVASASAGDNRGLLMMPVPGEEVVVGFEHGDTRRPYVLGSLWNGDQKPGDLAQSDGSFALRSVKRGRIASKGALALTSEEAGVEVSGRDTIAISTDADFVVETKGKVSHTATGELAAEGREVRIKANGGKVSLEATTELELKVGAASIKLSPPGMVEINGISISIG